MEARTVRKVSFVICALAIVAIIVSSIADNDGAAITFGLLAAVAVICQIVATSVAAGAGTSDVDDLGRRVEDGAEALLTAGADEHLVRALVRDAVRLGRARNGV